MRSVCARGGFLLIAGVLFGSGAPAQDYRAKVQGVVTDSSEAVIVGAKVTLANINTGIASSKETSASGQYVFDFVEPGSYTVTVEQTGFNKFVQENITVQVRADITVNPVLTVGSVAEQVTVSETLPSVKFNTSTVDLTIDRKMLTDLPILGRNPFRLALIDPSVVDRGWGANNPFDMWGAATIDIGGATNGKLDLLLDGAPLMMTNKASYAPPMDAVQEFTVQQNSVDAEFGNSAGGIMSLAMASGSNAFHGTAYYFGRNPKLNAVSDAISRTPNFVRNHIWGGTVGHPVKKNKLFAFTAWEQWRTKDPRLNLRTMPTDLERTGDFSRSLNADGGLRTIYDPWSTVLDSAGKVTRTPFAGNRIPAQRIDSTAARFVQDIWKPNNPGDDITGVNNFKESYTWFTDYWNFSNRMDYNVTDKWRVFSRYSQFRNRIDEAHTVDTPAMPKDEGGNMFSLNITGDSVYVVNANTVLNVSGSYGSIQDDYACPTCEVQDSDLAEFWPNKWFAPYTKDLPVMYYPNLNIGDAYFGHRFFWIEHPKNASAHVKLVQTRGRHDIKTGFMLRRNWGFINYPDPMTFNFGPALTADTFLNPDTSLSGDSYATFLLGAISNDSWAQYKSPHELTTNNYGFYLQDDFKLNRRITLNLGLRYEYETAPADAQDRISRYLDLTNPIPEFQSAPPQIPDAVTALAKINYQWNGAWIFASSDKRGMFNTSKLAFMPRAGIAIRINDQTSVRIGYGRNVVPPSQMQPFQTTAITLYGYTAQTYVAPSQVGIPGGNLSDPFPATNPLILPTGKALGRYQNLGASPLWRAQDLKSTVSNRATFSIQRQLPQQFSVDATFLMNYSSNVPWTRNLNQSDPNLGYTYKTETARTVPNPFYNILTPETFPGSLRYQRTVSIGSLLRPYPHYTGLSEALEPDRLNRYHSVQLRVQRRSNRGYSLLWAYAYNREYQQEFFNADDQYVELFTYIDSASPRHRMSLTGSYDLPFGKGRPFLANMNSVLNAVLGGWSTSGLFTYNSGAFLRFGGALVDGNPRIDNPTRSRYFDTSKFQVLPAYTRRTNPWQYPGVTGPRFANMDATLSKFFPLRGESMRLEFKMEAYNLTNSFMASSPNVTVTSSLFGRSTGQANRGREMQYTLRLHF
ncbi:MAG: TonB-dependent receptor [Bryobacterales bacterium]|nr:TonB-dependent receptor [Bryobacterales bacterium]